MKVVVLAGFDQSLLNFRGSLLRAMVQAGCEVVGVAPAQDANVPPRLEAMGVRFVPSSLARAGLNPFADLASLFRLRVIIKRERPDVVMSYTIKSVIYGSLAARWAGVPRVYALITGLGAAFHTRGAKGWLLRWIAVNLYRVALRGCTKVFVQNRDIAELFAREGIAPEQKIVVVPGSGVETDRFVYSALPDGPPVFLYLGRLLRDKGIAELVAAARLLKARHSEARVVLIGDTDPNPASFSATDVTQWKREEVVEHVGFQADVRQHLRNCTAFVLPSYHEGLPRSVLEAMAVGRPIITTNTIGCRETVFEATSRVLPDTGIRRGLNGYLVPVRSIETLAQAMEQIVQDRSMAIAMGKESRRLAEQHFDARIVNNLMLGHMGLGLS